MQIIEFLAKLTDRARTVAERAESFGEAHVLVQTPDGIQHHIRDVAPNAQGIVLFVE